MVRQAPRSRSHRYRFSVAARPRCGKPKAFASCIAGEGKKYGQSEERVMRVWSKIERTVDDIRNPDALLRVWCEKEDWGDDEEGHSASRRSIEFVMLCLCLCALSP